MKILILFVIFFSLSSTAFSQYSSVEVDRLLTDIQKIVNEEKIAGLMIGIATKDTVVFSGGFGYADLENKVPVDENTLFRMGSITKMFVSLGIMKLVEAGKLNLDDELSVIAPEVPFVNNWEQTHPLRVVHLLEHTSGFDDIKLNRMYSMDTTEYHGKEMMLTHERSMVCRWKPGERTSYSNPNYTILGFIIERITGKHWNEYLREVILEPLGMTRTNFNCWRKNDTLNVKEYIIDEGTLVAVPSVTMIGGPQGSMWSSSKDMVKFLQMFLRDGAPLVPATIIKEIETPHSALAARAGLRDVYSLGNFTTFERMPYPFRGHNGLAGTCASSLFYNRDLDVGFVLASNSNSMNFRIAERIVTFLVRNLPGDKVTPIAFDAEAIKPFLGYYEFGSARNEIVASQERLQMLRHVYIEEGVLWLKEFAGNRSRLIQTGPLTFTWPDNNIPGVVFTYNDEGIAVMSIRGTYFEKTPGFVALSKRIMILIIIVVALSSVVVGIVSLIGFSLGRVRFADLLVRLIPVAGIACLIWAFSKIMEIQQFTYLLCELGEINARTITIFGGTLAFAVAALAVLVLIVRNFRQYKNRWFAWYYLLVGIALCMLTILLTSDGWIALRTWAL